MTVIQPLAGQVKPLPVPVSFQGRPMDSQRIMPRFEGDMRRKYIKEGVVETFEDVVVLGGARTPFGKLGGPFKDVSATDLLSIAMKGTMEKAKVDPKDVKQVIIGNIIANDSQKSFMPRAIGIRMGVKPGESIAMEVNRLCGTGFEAARQAAQQLSNGGEDAVILTGGVENMTQTPVMDSKRMMMEEKIKAMKKMAGKKGLSLVDKVKLQIGIMQEERKLKNHKLSLPYGDGPLNDGLTDPSATIMIGTADELARRWGLTRNDVDDYAYMSQQRYKKALDEGRFKEEIVPVTKASISKGRLPRDVEVVDKDSHPRPEGERKKLGSIPVQMQNRKDAVHTGGNSSGLVDGAAAVALSSGAFAKEKNLPILAKLKSVAVTGCDPNIMGFGPARAIPEALKAAGVTLKEVDFVEVNEAFAGQVLAVAKSIAQEGNISIDELMAKLNVDGGSIPIGHPLSASGSRILIHAANRLKDDNKRYAVVSACIGGGQGIAMVIENPNYKPEGADA